jgi:hypothetical protein
LYTTADLVEFFDRIKGIVTETGAVLTCKLVLRDNDGNIKRRDRQRNDLNPYEIREGRDALKKRLAMYKNSKKPTVETIHQFIDVCMAKPGSTVQFAGYTYRLTPVDSYTSDKMSGVGLLAGNTFKIEYKSVDPGESNSVDITYIYDNETNQLLPIMASWYDRSDGRVSQEAVLDANGYLKSKLSVKKLTKELVIPKILTLVQSNKLKLVKTLLVSLKKMNLDWPELDTIEQSVDTSLAAAKKA